ncbi:hypothetical protein HD_0943 [[Haemophilus] ducreyi 35000HP]|uniref:Uncharacterized protein n=2 Tax=Haemophilus ducreyi TaxID=730 RepID=Q7VMN1_HAEDU|nr:hypothetical protein HD_0943 [[Haemophilus] ducreyi 35000HP]
MRQNYHAAPNWWESSFSEYTPSRDIAEAFQLMASNKATAVVNDELQYGDIDMPGEEEDDELNVTDDIDDENDNDDGEDL